MYQWYKDAQVCYAFLAGVGSEAEEDPSEETSTFQGSRWFTRGWTLQELIAPRQIEFYGYDWSHLGDKSPGSGFMDLVANVTHVQVSVLVGKRPQTAYVSVNKIPMLILVRQVKADSSPVQQLHACVGPQVDRLRELRISPTACSGFST